MAGLEGLASIIYHEKQQPGSMLCAQHALNSLLQGNYFTAPDLSDIARNLDTLEEQYDHSNTGNSSHNMDDTGFFSIQVLENALSVWGLTLTRWRREEMRPFQHHPHTQLAFILNLDQHWFTLRRFGPAFPNIDDDPGDGHWFNLNSSLSSPEWVGKLYLGMVLQQAETDGYSVFAVTQIDPSAPIALPRTEADEIASTLPEPHGTLSNMQYSSSFTQNPSATSASASDPSMETAGFEDEDYELQAALQASLMNPRPGAASESYNYQATPLAPPRLMRGFAPLPPSDPHTPSDSNSGVQTPTDGHSLTSAEQPADLDPVAASMERNRLMLQRMRQEQEYAQRELWVENATGPDAASLEARRLERQREEEEDAELLRRAIQESEALARIQGHAQNMDEDGDDDDMDVEAPGPPNTHPAIEQAVSHRVYDDDDAELQAALKASLEHVPEGWELPELLPPRTPAPPSSLSSTAALPDQTTGREGEQDKDDTESVLSDETSMTTTDNTASGAVAEAVSVDELRKRRLARFGT